MLHVRALLFDFDGVLADSEALHWRGLDQVARQRWDHAISREEYDNNLIALDDYGSIVWLAAQHGETLPALAVRSLVAEKQSYLADQLSLSPLLPGAEQIWRSACSGYRTAIVSGALRPEIEAILAHHHLPAPDTIIAAGESAHGKPAPTPYTDAIAQLGELVAAQGEPPLHPTHCLAIEDTAGGIASARHAGVWTIRLASGAPEPRPDEPQPHLTISSWQNQELSSLCQRISTKEVI